MTTDEPGGLDRAAARGMYSEYLATPAHPPLEEPAVERFGDSRALADELIGLVLAGTKRATAALVSSGSQSCGRRRSPTGREERRPPSCAT